MNLLPEKYRYIVVEGPIGAGKTSLARLLAERSGSAALLEDPDANPFLPGFYHDPRATRCRRNCFSCSSA